MNSGPLLVPMWPGTARMANSSAKRVDHVRRRFFVISQDQNPQVRSAELPDENHKQHDCDDDAIQE